jgi:hypothetical protein
VTVVQFPAGLPRSAGTGAEASSSASPAARRPGPVRPDQHCALIDYDNSRHAEMVNTLAHFLDCGGNHDHTAQSLLIRRSTLRYRLRRIRELGALDLDDTETRLNLHPARGESWMLDEIAARPTVAQMLPIAAYGV